MSIWACRRLFIEAFWHRPLSSHSVVVHTDRSIDCCLTQRLSACHHKRTELHEFALGTQDFLQRAFMSSGCLALKSEVDWLYRARVASRLFYQAVCSRRCMTCRQMHSRGTSRLKRTVDLLSLRYDPVEMTHPDYSESQVFLSTIWSCLVMQQLV